MSIKLATAGVTASLATVLTASGTPYLVTSIRLVNKDSLNQHVGRIVVSDGGVDREYLPAQDISAKDFYFETTFLPLEIGDAIKVAADANSVLDIIIGYQDNV